MWYATLMNEQELLQKIDALALKVEQVYQTSEKTRKYFLWTLIVTLILFVIPLVGLFFAVPSFLSTYSEVSNF